MPDLASPAAQVVVGDSHACALRTGEDVVCWGTSLAAGRRRDGGR
ncbi:RCC1-like domain-containing protein [Nannocystis pusilla]